MQAAKEKSPDKNKARLTKERREKSDRRQKIKKLISQLDRRNIQDRRNIKDRRLSQQKTFLFPVAQQGLSIKALNFEQDKLTKYLDEIISTGESAPSLSLLNQLNDVYFALLSQESKEEVLFQWYTETLKHAKHNVKHATLVSQLNTILEQEMKSIIAVLKKYLSETIDLDENRHPLIQDMKSVAAAFRACT